MSVICDSVNYTCVEGFLAELVPGEGLTSRGKRRFSLDGVIKLFWQFVLHFIRETSAATANFMNTKFFAQKLREHS